MQASSRCAPKARQTIVGTAIPKITDEFGGLDDVSWYGAAYFMTFGGLEAAWGKAFKYFDLKITFIISVLIVELGSQTCGVGPNSTALIVGPAVAGVGGAGISVGGTSVPSAGRVQNPGGCQAFFDPSCQPMG